MRSYAVGCCCSCTAAAAANDDVAAEDDDDAAAGFASFPRYSTLGTSTCTRMVYCTLASSYLY